jgi:hypothetical protein
VKQRLLLDSEAVEHLDKLPARERTLLRKRLCAIADAPDRFTDYHERDAHGRDLSGHVFHGHAILFWDDFADRHLKILEVTNADDFPPP